MTVRTYFATTWLRKQCKKVRRIKFAKWRLSSQINAAQLCEVVKRKHKMMSIQKQATFVLRVELSAPSQRIYIVPRVVDPLLGVHWSPIGRSGLTKSHWGRQRLVLDTKRRHRVVTQLENHAKRCLVRLYLQTVFWEVLSGDTSWLLFERYTLDRSPLALKLARKTKTMLPTTLILVFVTAVTHFWAMRWQRAVATFMSRDGFFWSPGTSWSTILNGSAHYIPCFILCQ